MPSRSHLIRTGIILAAAFLSDLASGPARAARATTPTVTHGAIVWVANTSPYYEAGLRSRDIITRANDKPVRNDTDLYKALAATTHTTQIAVEGLRMDKDEKGRWVRNKVFRVMLPNYLPADITIGSYSWDWVRYLKYYAPDPASPDPLIEQAYASFDNHQYPTAQIQFTSATAAGHKDPLTVAKYAWLLLRRASGKTKAQVEQAGKLLKQAEEDFDPTQGDHETHAKIEGILMVYYQKLNNFQLAGIHAHKALQADPDLVGNRINFYQMLMGQKTDSGYRQAALQTASLVDRYPRSIYFLRLKRNAHLRIGDVAGVIEAGEALVNILPDDVASRLQLLPALDQIGDNYRTAKHCEYILRAKTTPLTDKQRAEVSYYQARIHMRRGITRRAEPLARRAVQLRGNGEEHYLLAQILQKQKKWKAATLTYREARRKPWSVRRSRDLYREMQSRSDDCVRHLWSWQVKNMPPDVQQRRQWLDERKVLRHSFVMRHRYQIRNVLIVIGVLMILTGVLLRVFATNY